MLLAKKPMPSTTIQKLVSDSSELARQAELLRTSRFFVGTCDDYVFAEKQPILLALAGLKPVSEATSGHWVDIENGRRTVADDPKEVGAFLNSLGLVYELWVDEDNHGTTAVVSRRPELVAEYMQASDAETVGRLFGYPATAVSAFVSHTSIPIEEQEKIEQAESFGLFRAFWFSQSHWQEELTVAKRWYEALERYGFIDGQSQISD